MISPNPAGIEPRELDLVMRDNDFVIYYGENPLVTPKGAEVAHQDSRVLKHLIIKLTLARQIDYSRVNSFSIFSFCKDYLEAGSDPLADRLDEVMAGDLLLGSRLDPVGSHRTLRLQQALEDPDDESQFVHLTFMGASVIMKSLRDFLGPSEDPISFIREQYAALSPERKAAVNLLSSFHVNGIVLPMMLVMSKISPSEYALAALGAHTNSEENFREIHEQAMKAMEFLGFFDAPGKKMSVIAELISQGENDQLEFKSTFRWDIRQAKKNPAIEHAALKSVTAFLNSDGGDLLVGVADDGSIIGIETDQFANDDKFLLHVWNLIKTSIGQDVSPYIRTTLEKIDGKTVCRVSCKRSPKPVFLRQSGFDEMFYIRIGPSSGNLEISEALKYIGERF